MTVVLVAWSHYACMTTNPGCVPKSVKKLNYKRLPTHMQNIIKQLGVRMKHLATSIEGEKKKTKSVIELID